MLIPSLRQFDDSAARAIDMLASRRWAASLFLLALTLATYLPGVLLLPPVDRTEIQYASASRQMLAEGNFADPRFRGDQLQGKPIGAFWLQMASLGAAGDAAKSNITVYRLPSLLGVVLAVLATFWLLSPLLGGRAALVSAALIAVTPLFALDANLAVADGIALAAAVVAQLALLRIYCAGAAPLAAVAGRPLAPAVATPSPRLRGEGRGEGRLHDESSDPVALPDPPDIAEDDGERKRDLKPNPSPQGGGELPSLSRYRIPSPLWGGLGWGESQTPGIDISGLALLFWVAQGLGVLVNALAVPLLSLATLAALFVFDRRIDWLVRLRPLIGVPIMLVLGAPWLVTRAIADGGVPFQGMDGSELLAALGGSQADKWKAAPGSFTAALILGFLPGALLLFHALWRLWLERGEHVGRFLLAWIGGPLVYLELISGKPALYSAQPLFPAAAAAVALALTQGQPWTHPLTLPARLFAPPGWASASFVLVVFGVLLWLADASLTPLIAAGALAAALLFFLGAEAVRLRLGAAWISLSVAGFAFYLAYTFGLFLPHLEKAWPAPRIAEAIAPLRACAAAPAGITGFREPSATFALNAVIAEPSQIAGWAASGERRVALVEQRWREDFARELLVREAPEPKRLGCVEAFNVMRGCSLSFSVYLTGQKDKDAPGCRMAPEFACPAAPPPAREDAKEKSRCR